MNVLTRVGRRKADDGSLRQFTSLHENLFNFRRTDPVALALDLAIGAGEEIDKAVLVRFHQVAGIANDVAALIGGNKWVRTQHLTRQLGFTPVSMRNSWAALDQDSWLAGFAGAPIRTDDQDFRFGNRFADRVGTAIHL